MQFENKHIKIVKTKGIQMFFKGATRKNNKAKFTLLWGKTALEYIKIL